jgi:hypothetical protein
VVFGRQTITAIIKQPDQTTSRSQLQKEVHSFGERNMTRLTGVTAALLVAGGISIAAAQEPKAPGASPPGAGSVEPKAPPKDAIPEKIAPGSEKKSGSEERSRSGKASESRDKAPTKSTEAPDKSKKSDRARNEEDGKGGRATTDRGDTSSSPKTADEGKARKSGDSDRKNSASTESKDKKSSSKTGERTEKDKARARADDAKDRAGREETPKAAAPDDSKRKTATPGDKSDATKKSVQLSQQQRTTIRQKLENERSGHTANVKFNISIGTSVPREVRLYPIPPSVVEIVPAYRSYRYVWVADEIVIVDPQTYVIVAVVDRDGGSHAAAPSGHAVRLSLSDSERRMVVREVTEHRDGQPLEGLSIEIGRQLPDSIRLTKFPEPVIEEVPKLRDYRYVLTRDEIVIVDARDAIVALTIEQ